MDCECVARFRALDEQRVIIQVATVAMLCQPKEGGSKINQSAT
jgi:hypothetical protein